ncbi:MAG: response regulator transcription factor [Anaerolineales bacterium]|nr:MAG: response regulator transcription factor [Anaerolineales bacterium]
MKFKILWIEGKRAEGPSFVPTLRKKGYYVEIVSTGSEALRRLFEIDPDLAIIHSASMRTSGKRICKSLRDKVDEIPILVIASANSDVPEDICAQVVLKLPFTSRKLINRIVPLLPGNGENMLHVGPIRLDMETKQVRCQGREANLTPRLAELLKTLMQNPGTVLQREELFKNIWKTEYLGDTRTLDVHMSWLRQAIEEDPRKPQLIKTIRGVGYRLDI